MKEHKEEKSQEWEELLSLKKHCERYLHIKGVLFSFWDDADVFAAGRRRAD